MKEKKIAVVYPLGQLSIIPSLVGIIETLADNGYTLDLFLCENPAFPATEFKSPKIDKYILGSDENMGSLKWKFRYLSLWIPKLAVKCRSGRYICIIGVDPLGLVLSYLPAVFFKIPLIYFSLELLIYSELSSAALRYLKSVEKKASKTACLTIIQDVDRAEILMHENGTPKEKIALLPNAPTGEAVTTKSLYLRESLGISPDRIIVLHSGSIHPMMMVSDLAEEAKSWDNNIAMVFHSRNRFMSDYEKNFISLIDSKKTYLSHRPAMLDNYADLVASADIGIALYEKNLSNINVFCMGLSSGKIAYYLKYGLPVVVSSLPSLKKLVEEYRCGVAVDSVHEVKVALSIILANYDAYSRNAIRCFNEKYQFKKHAGNILKRLQMICGRQN